MESELPIRSEKLLLEALERMGYDKSKVIVQKGRHLEGYHGDRREQTADVTIPRKHLTSASNDIGFEKLPNGFYKLLESEYDGGGSRGGAMRHFKKRLMFSYGEGLVKRQMKGQGWKQLFKKEEVNKKSGKKQVRIKLRRRK